MYFSCALQLASVLSNDVVACKPACDSESSDDECSHPSVTNNASNSFDNYHSSVNNSENDCTSCDECTSISSEVEDNDECNSDSEIADGEENDKEEHSNSPHLHDYTDISVTQAVILIIAFKIRHGLNNTVINDLLQLLHLLLPVPSSLPRTYYLFKKYFSYTAPVYHFCCLNQSCKSLIVPPANVCHICDHPFSEKECLDKGSFFLTLDLASQLKSVLETKGVGDKVVDTSVERNTVCDIWNGSFYREFNILNAGLKKLTLTWNCDGVPLFKSSKNSLWPIRCMINELPFSVATNYVLLAAIYFGKCKPCMTSLLEPFVNMINNINEVGGVKWFHPIEYKLISSHIYASFCCCDAPARCQVQGINQYNGEYGCSWCLEKGNMIQKGRGYTRVYDTTDKPQCCRTHDLMFEHGVRSTEHVNVKHVMGVQTLSPLFNLQKFDMVKSFVPDYMHCVLLGIVRQFLSMWFDSKYHEQSWYIGTKSNIIDQRLLSIKPPCDIKRLPRSVKFAQMWKASECKNWLLHYSVYALHNVIANKYLRHWLLLVDSLYLLLGTEVTGNIVDRAELKLLRFIRDVPILYGKEFMVYNVHQLIHLCDSVRTCGPIWRTSAFPFESNNLQLLKLFAGTNYVPVQIAESMCLLRSIPVYVKEFETSNNSGSYCVVQLLNRWLRGYPLLFRAVKVHDMVLLGIPLVRSLHGFELSVLRHYNINLFDEKGEFFKRVIIRNRVFCTLEYGSQLKTASYFVQLKNGHVGCIESIVKLPRHKCFIFVRLYENENTNALCFGICTDALNIRLTRKTNVLVAVQTEDIIHKCIFLQEQLINEENWFLFSCQPNVIEKD